MTEPTVTKTQALTKIQQEFTKASARGRVNKTGVELTKEDSLYLTALIFCAYSLGLISHKEKYALYRDFNLI